MRERKVVKRWIPATGVTVIPRHREHHGGMGLLNQTVHARNQGATLTRLLRSHDQSL